MAGLSLCQRFAKRSLDVSVAVIGLLLTGWLVALLGIVSTVDTARPGFFIQKRVGRDGRLFPLIKIRTMKSAADVVTTVTTSDDQRITRFGRFLRRSKLDELPQLINVLLGHMSLVGPRPDVPGFADCLRGQDRVVLSVRPGITGPATLAFRDEEALLATQDDPERYNREVLFPAKVRLNRRYVENYRFRTDLEYLLATVFRSPS